MFIASDQQRQAFLDPSLPNPISKSTGGILNLDTYDSQTAWDVAFNVVNYPVSIEPLFFSNKASGALGQDIFTKAQGTTNTNKSVEFFGIAVDRNRTGSTEIIATVTDSYHTIKTETVYKDLKSDLDELKIHSHPERIYVSNNGGRQTLTVNLPDFASPVLSVGKITLSISLVTSIDGTLAHAIRVSPQDEQGRDILGLQSDFSFSTRHTKNLKDRHIAFTVVIEKMLEEWNEIISPMLSLLDGEELNSNLALELTKNILETSKIPDRHIRRMESDLEASNKQHTVLTVIHGITEYLDDELGSTKPERIDQFRKALNKNTLAVIKKKLNLTLTN